MTQTFLYEQSIVLTLLTKIYVIDDINSVKSFAKKTYVID